MAKYIIVGVILLVWAVIEGVSWFWTKKLLDKREEGLDRRQEQLKKKESALTKWERALEEKRKILEAFVPESGRVSLFNRVNLHPVQVAYAQCVTYRELAQFGVIDPEGWNGAQRQIIQRCRSKAIENCLNAARDLISVGMEMDEQDAALVIHARLWVCQE